MQEQVRSGQDVPQAFATAGATQHTEGRAAHARTASVQRATPLPVQPTHLQDYRAPAWLLGGHVQTIWSALHARRYTGAAPVYQRERWNTPDGDFIDVDVQEAPANPHTGQPAPLLVLFHGLEGSSRSHYAEAFAAQAAARGWSLAVPHFRGCSGSVNLAPRVYHSGDYEEVDWILTRFVQRQQAKVAAHRAAETVPGDAPVLLAAGVSLGGNALLRWAEEAGEQATRTVRAVAAISSPIDLEAGGAALGRGVNRQIYTRMFLNTLKPKAMAKLAQFPGLFDRERLLAARDLYEFDDVFTAPVHGFAGALDYWRRASAKPHLHQVRVPALVLNARNDPFVPATSLPAQQDVGTHVTLWQPAHGGHVGFASGGLPGDVQVLPQAVLSWLNSQL